LSIASGLLLALAQPPYAVGLLGLVALVPLLLALRRQSLLVRAALGWICGTVWSFAMVGSWLWPAAANALEIGNSGAFLVTLAATQMYGGLHIAVFAMLLGQRRRGGIADCFAIAAIWVAVELLRSAAFGGVPWGLLGHSLWQTPELIQLAAFTGVAGVSFWMVVVNAALVEAVLRMRARRSPAAPLLLGLGLIAAVWLHGSWRCGRPLAGEPVVVRVVHSDWQLQRSAGARVGGGADDDRHVDRMIELSRGVGPAEITVWPEASVRLLLSRNPSRAHDLYLLARDTGGDLLFGAPRSGDGELFNSYYRVSANAADIVEIVDKRRLVPLAESAWRGLPASHNHFAAGERAASLGVGKGRSVGVLICFEALFPDLAIASGGDFLVNPSNDARVGSGAGQQAAMAVFRAVENGRSLLRVANAGPSLLVDGYGRIEREVRGWGAVLWRVPPRLASTPFRSIAKLWAQILPRRSSGDGLLAWACLAFTLAQLCWRG